MTKTILMAILLAAGASGVHAGETFSSDGVGKGTNETTIEVIGEGHMLMHSVSTYESFESADAKSPYAGMTGKCWGAIEIKAPGASGGGNCVFTGTSGDKNFNSWTVKGLGKDGALIGIWSAIGGTGMFQNSSGGGKFHSLADRETGKFVNTIEGAITLK